MCQILSVKKPRSQRGGVAKVTLLSFARRSSGFERRIELGNRSRPLRRGCCWRGRLSAIGRVPLRRRFGAKSVCAGLADAEYLHARHTQCETVAAIRNQCLDRRSVLDVFFVGVA